ncbi:MAG: alpha/beta fold hydrolase [Alphaproteobacteria bacterium]|nr:alpha/beta fold hydrolase [Alphaproteobacteria bacterium]
MAKAARSREKFKLGSVEIETVMCGEGRPLLLLAGEEQLEFDHPFIDDLARDHRVIMPSPPGFGRSPRPDWFTNTDDIAYVYLDLARKLALKDAVVAGFAHGGWIAAEMAVKDDSFMSKLVLTGAYGVKTGGPYDVDIADIWIAHPSKVVAMKWADPARGKRDFSAMNDDELTVVAQNIETFARYCWEPYMHNPKLRHRLHRISTPALFIWGEKDGMTSPAYGRAYAGLVPGAKFTAIADAGHYPHLEQNAAFMKAFRDFIA